MFVFGRIPWFHFTKIVIPVKISACSTSSAGAFLNLFVLANETPDESMMIPQSSDRIWGLYQRWGRVSEIAPNPLHKYHDGCQSWICVGFWNFSNTRNRRFFELFFGNLPNTRNQQFFDFETFQIPSRPNGSLILNIFKYPDPAVLLILKLLKYLEPVGIIALVFNWYYLKSLQSMYWYKAGISPCHTRLVSPLMPGHVPIYVPGFQPGTRNLIQK